MRLTSVGQAASLSDVAAVPSAPDPLALAARLLNATADGTQLTVAVLRDAAVAVGYPDARVDATDVELVSSVLPTQRRLFGAER